MAADRPFFVADPTMTFTLLRSNRDLADLAGALGADRGEIDGWTAELEAGAGTLWNDALGSYDSRDVVSGEWANSISNASFLCWWGGVDNPRMLPVLHRVMDAVPYAIASYDPEGPKFDARRYWRGPVWGMMNALAGIGLAERGHGREAGRVRDATRRLIVEHGFAEYFDPVTGAPAGGKNFTWTAAIWLAWASPSAGEGR
jgi:glycogen debranching enzyme